MKPNQHDLEDLKLIQLECAKKVVFAPTISLEEIRYIGGMDLTFKDFKHTPTQALVSLVVIEYPSLTLIEKLVKMVKVTFPYVPTFLAFRELPALLEVYDSASHKPDVYFIDGQGLAHPRKCGIATHFGVETNTVAIGVAKSYLYGRYKVPCKNRGCKSLLYDKYKDEIIGSVVRTRSNVAPVFVSVGNKISLEMAIQLVMQTSRYRIPEPTRLAHNVLQEERHKIGW